jgi:hypothetical protein
MVCIGEKLISGIIQLADFLRINICYCDLNLFITLAPRRSEKAVSISTSSMPNSVCWVERHVEL